LIALGLLLASSSVKHNITHIVEGYFETTLNHSSFSRSVGMMNVRLSTFRYRVFSDDNFLQSEGEILQDLIRNLHDQSENNELRNVLQRLADNFSRYRQHCQWFNYLLRSRVELDGYIEQQLQILQELLADSIIDETLWGDETLYLQQLSQLVFGYYEDFLNIAYLNIAEDPSRFRTVLQPDASLIDTQLSELRSRIEPLLAAGPLIERLGKQLLDSVDYYHYLLRNYRQEMAAVAKDELQQEQLVTEIIATMRSFDAQARLTVAGAERSLRRTINITVSFVMAFVLLLVLLYWWGYRKAFKNHIQVPLSVINNRLKRFEQGDYGSPMRLGRDDEWGEIEVVFNQMVANLQKSVASLEQSEQRYRDIFNNASDGIYQATMSGKLIKANRVLFETFGYVMPKDLDLFNDQEFSSIDIRRDIYYRAEDRNQWIDSLQQQGEVHDFEVELLRRDGSHFWASISGHLVYDSDGQPDYIEGIVRDISERREDHAVVERLHRYLQDIIDSMPSVLIGVNRNMEVTLWNKRAEQESAFSAEEVRGFPLKKACRLFDEVAYQEALAETLLCGKPTRLLKVKSIKKTGNGGRRSFDILIYPLAADETGGAVIYMEEVTERLQLEQMMVRSEKMQSIGGLAAGLAHEINNPLAVVLQNAQVLSRRLSPELNKNCEVAKEIGTTMETIVKYTQARDCEKMIQMITVAGQRVAEIVRNIQNFSRYGASRFVFCSISELLERTLELVASDYEMRRNFDFGRIKLVREYQTVPEVRCESSQIQQVFLILLKNAAQALVGCCEERQITLKIIPSGDDHIAVQIFDNGAGMDAEVVTRIFDPFFTTQEVGEGTGLGLSIAYFIITHLHEGQLKVTSDPGQGSCFEIILPMGNSAEKEKA